MQMLNYTNYEVRRLSSAITDNHNMHSYVNQSFSVPQYLLGLAFVGSSDSNYK